MATSSTYVGVGRPASPSTAAMMGSKPKARRNGLVGPPMPIPVMSWPRARVQSGLMYSAHRGATKALASRRQ
eukprot:13923521-Alexandrium_andersonii.AAC.1